ncbi:hypothetical protein L1987_21502 [Smallanthus sonchifolius]|uniref:Uncharacterized protein n=1 Tax=Smallanthus sonchifolius TaxID=185202 RepID=A0ACB9IVA6_9ASTR|nr:hypothetical protein L1987_21502 [Smallanthus sonchifolius]
MSIEDGTYVKHLSFPLLWVPLFPLKSLNTHTLPCILTQPFLHNLQKLFGNIIISRNLALFLVGCAK